VSVVAEVLLALGVAIFATGLYFVVDAKGKGTPRQRWAVTLTAMGLAMAACPLLLRPSGQTSGQASDQLENGSKKHVSNLNTPSKAEDNPQLVTPPKSHTKPKPLIARAGEPLTVDGLTFVMSRCGNTNDSHVLRCEGKVVNGGDDRLPVRLTGGVATDDAGKQSGLCSYLVGCMAGTFLGAADNSSSELTPGVPVQFGFVLKWKSDATAYSVDFGLSTSGPQPTTRQISFINIPVSD
jgi:hypothetical protein